LFSTPAGAAKLLLLTVLGLFTLKVIVGIVTGSVSIWAQAVDSSLDIFAVIVTFLTVGFSTKPADQEHPFGHGKVEDIAAGIQAALLLVASGSIAYAAIQRIISGSMINLPASGAAVMLVSLIVNIYLSHHLFKVAKATGSVALEANANNIRGDVYSTAGVLLGLAIVSFYPTLSILDPIIALLVVALILRATYRVGRMAWSGLIDVRLPTEEERHITETIREHTTQLAGFHKIRTRKAGSQRFVDFHLLLPKNISVEEAHKMCDHLEEDIKSKLPNSSVTIHVEPCSVDCEQCLVSSCSHRLDIESLSKIEDE
jgi:cation diffusion facilitator family transporter